ncbi:hypothetical protein BKA81DRAFT_75509 [Phyllosticta paracitricarpa]
MPCCVLNCIQIDPVVQLNFRPSPPDISVFGYRNRVDVRRCPRIQSASGITVWPLQLQRCGTVAEPAVTYPKAIFAWRWTPQGLNGLCTPNCFGVLQRRTKIFPEPWACSGGFIIGQDNDIHVRTLSRNVENQSATFADSQKRCYGKRPA